MIDLILSKSIKNHLPSAYVDIFSQVEQPYRWGPDLANNKGHYSIGVLGQELPGALLDESQTRRQKRFTLKTQSNKLPVCFSPH